VTGERKNPDWEAIEREYRAGRLTVVEIGRQYGLSHTAINKRAKRDGWKRNLADRVRKEVSARLVSEQVSPETERAAIEPAVARGVQVVREHQGSIGRGQRLVGSLFSELEEATENRTEIETAIEDETRGDKERRARMLRAVALPSRSSVIVNLSSALKTLVGLERQAFSLDADGAGPDGEPPITLEALIMASLKKAGDKK
jgi:hypothetical protein